MVQFVSGIHVVYGSAPAQEPINAVTEISGLGDDVNKDFGGGHVYHLVVLTIAYEHDFRYVWIVADFTTNPDHACNRFVVVIQDNADTERQDLAKGAGGKYRYLLPFASPADSNKITDIRLLRSDSAVDAPPAGYDGMTDDINRGRQKSYLYVIWKSIRV